MAQEMNMTCNIVQNIDTKEVIISFAGHLDTATSAEANAKINRELADMVQVNSLICDAMELEYISSSGLRILLSLTKRFKDFRVINVQSQVYEVLETTGFTKIMTVERAVRRLSVKGCRLIGIGNVGKVYRLDGDTIIKVFREGTTMEEVRREITLSKEAFVLGMPTPISFDVVKVVLESEGSPECYGLVYELLKAKTLSTFLKQHPERLDEFAMKFADLYRQMHEIEVPVGTGIPSAIEHEHRQIEHIRRYFSEESLNILHGILDCIPPAGRLLHLDLQTKNVMVQDDELMLIDMGEVSYGNPLLDLGHSYSSMVGLIGDYEKTIGIPRELGQRFWDKAIRCYFDGRMSKDIKAQIEVVSLVRNFSWLALSDSFPQNVIEECKATFNERVAMRIDYIKDVCQTLSDWKL